jgi:hypothetical protein
MSLKKQSYSTKPLKGYTLTANAANLGTISGGAVTFTKLNVDNFIEDGVISNIVIRDSTILNSIIGVGGATEAYFTLLHTSNDVELIGLNPTQSVKWDSTLGVFTVTGQLKVNGCTYLDNIEICENYIRADNLNGDVNILSNNFGTIFLKGGISHNATTGNYSSIITNGSNTQIAKNNVIITSSSESLSLTSAKDTILQTLNGSIQLNTDTTNSTKAVLLIDNTNGNIRVSSNYNTLRTGDIITLSSTLFNGKYTVQSILNETQFLVGTSGSFSNITSGSFKKINNNDILLNASRSIIVPENIPLIFNNTNNSIYYNTTSGLLLNSFDNFTFNSLTQNSLIKVPQTSFLQFGNSSGNSIRLNTSSNLQIKALGDVIISSGNLIINSSNVSITDPIISLAKYTSNSSDLKDRGVEYNWFDTSSNLNKLGWFGYKSSSKLFSFIPDATNTNEVITGSLGNFAISNINADSITLNPNGLLNMNCGKITNIKEITGCGNNVYFNLQNINLNNNSFINLNTNGNYITSNTLNNILINSSNNIVFNTISNGSIIIPDNTKIVYGNNNFISGSNGNLNLVGLTNIYLSASTNGSVVIPQNTSLSFNGTTNQVISIISTTGNLTLNSSNGSILLNSSYTTINGILTYGIDRYTLQSGVTDFKNPDLTKMVSLFKVIGPNYITSSGTMGSTNVKDGSLKIISCTNMGIGCIYTLQFPINTLIAPNPLNINLQPTKIVFKRQGQSVQLMFNAIDTQWILISSNAYIY